METVFPGIGKGTPRALVWEGHWPEGEKKTGSRFVQKRRGKPCNLQFSKNMTIVNSEPRNLVAACSLQPYMG